MILSPEVKGALLLAATPKTSTLHSSESNMSHINNQALQPFREQISALVCGRTVLLC